MLKILGYSYAANEGLAYEQCQAFKDFMWNSLHSRNGNDWFLKTVHEESKIGIGIEYDPANAEATIIAEKAAALSPSIWESIRMGERPRFRIKQTSHGLSR